MPNHKPHSAIHVADQLFAFLYKLGIRRVFGIPGDELEIFDALGHSDLEFVTTRHEQGAAFMAAAMGKVGPLPGVCISTLGPGATNLVTGVADAYQNRVPLLVLSGQLGIKSHSENPLVHQYINLVKLFEPVTKATYLLSDSKSLVDTVAQALRTAQAARPGPVHITLPVDIMEEVANGPIGAVNLLKSSRAVSQTTLAKAIKVLKTTRFPVAFLGQTAQAAHPAFRSILAQSRIPVVTSFLGKGAFSEYDQWSLGVMSRHVKDKLATVLDQADLFLVFGYDYVEGIQPEVFKGKKIIVLDEVSLAKEGLLQPDVELVGPAEVISRQLAQAITQAHYRAAWPPSNITAVRQERARQLLAVQKLDSVPFNPLRIMQVLQELTQGDATIVSDVGIHKQVIALGYKTKRPLSVHFSNGLSAMGFALPFAAGLRFSQLKEKNIIAISGDGGFLMNVQELETIKRYNLDLKILVLYDNAFGMIKNNLVQKYQRVNNLDFTNPDFGDLAKSFGIKYIQASEQSDLRRILKALLNSSGPTLLALSIRYS